jgi:hypothetical protein
MDGRTRKPITNRDQTRKIVYFAEEPPSLK